MDVPSDMDLDRDVDNCDKSKDFVTCKKMQHVIQERGNSNVNPATVG